MRKFSLIVLLMSVFISSTSLILAQSQGIIKGKIVDEQTGDALIGATVMVKDQKKGAKTKFDGTYIIKNVSPGTYTVVVSYLGYQKQEITGVTVASEPVSLDVALKSAAIQGEEIIVEAKAIMETGAALLAERQKATSFSDAIGAEEIQRTGGGDAADAIKKVTGATTVGGKHVFIRGLGSRYASTELNGAALPSADPDKKSVHLDLFPSGLLENITTVKTATPDKPGDFTGGAVMLKTKSFPDKLNLNVKMTSGMNTNATGQNMILGSSFQNDWMGMGKSDRSIPSIVNDIRAANGGDFINRFDLYSISDPQEKEAQYSLLEQASRAFDPNMAPITTTGSFNRSMSISFGNQNQLFGGKNAIGYLASFSYNRRYNSYNDGEFNLYQLTGSSSDALWQVQDFKEYKGTDEVNWGGMFNVAYSFFGGHEVSYNLMINQAGENRALWRSGWMETSGLNYEQGFESRANRYIERAMNSHQIKGKHNFKSLWDVKLDWMVSLASTSQDEPDFKMFAYQYEAQLDEDGKPMYDSDGRVIADESNPNYSMSPSNGYRIPSRFFRQMNENLNSYGANLEIPLDEMVGSPFKVKTGFLLSRKDRQFVEDLFQYETDTGRPIDDTDVNGASYDFDPQTVFDRRVGIVDTIVPGLYDYGMYINMIPSNAIYIGDQSIDAFYGMVDFFVGKNLRFIGGLRHERTDIFTQKNDLKTIEQLDQAELDIQTYRDELSNTTDPQRIDQLNSLIDQNNSVLDSLRPGFVSNDFLPSFNMVYSLSKDMNLRAAYGKTIARPNFREIANYAVEEIIGGYILNGNPFLERTLVDNYDLRWEWFMNPGEIFAISGFYKDFTNPIQMRLGLNNNTKYVNVDQGTLLGAEIELRKNIGGMLKYVADVDQSFLNKMQFTFNLTLVSSQVSIDPTELEFIRAFDPNASATRPMNNQSPYVINFDLAYVDYEKGTDIGLNFNVFGDRLSVVTERGWPDIYEKPRPDLSFVASQRIYNNFKVRFSAQNILDSRYWTTQTYQGVDYIQSQYRRGRNFSLSFQYSFN